VAAEHNDASSALSGRGNAHFLSPAFLRLMVPASRLEPTGFTFMFNTVSRRRILVKFWLESCHKNR